jgi:DNA topoisomerase-1
MNNHLNWNFNLLYGGGSNNKSQWTSLIHNGPMFPPEYKPHKIPIIINNEKIILPELCEEYATMYAKFIDTDYMDHRIFKKNFWKEFKQILPTNLNILSLDTIDFSLIKDYLIKEKEKKTLLSKEEKLKIKNEQDIIEEPYKYCIIDNFQQQIGNFKIEPPGIFLGRGNHPKMGLIKKRIMPEDVTINLSKDAPIPKPNIPNHNWGEITHDQSVIWLASWIDEITGKNKYIFTSLDSIFKAKSDESKFDLAYKLKKKVNKIRESYENQLNDDNLKNRQLATALYFIDKLALRVGGSKDTKEEADTVGVTSLRVEHIVLLDDLNVKLDFLGKDSIRFCKKIKVSDKIYNNLKEFTNNKNKKDDLFDLITATSLNEYLTSYMPGLTSKVWRTYNASYLFQKEIDKINLTKIKDIDPNEKINYLLAMFNQANTSVALLCNHQKNNNKNNSSNNLIEKLDKKIKEFKKQKKIYQDKKLNDKVKKIQIKIKSYKLKKETKTKMKNVSLGTSKNNYIDPRIIFAFIKKFDIPSEKIFTKVLLKRFEWANKNDKDYKF